LKQVPTFYKNEISRYALGGSLLLKQKKMELDEYFKDLEAELETHRKALEKISVNVENYNLSAKVI
jgi:hypothetical protein